MTSAKQILYSKLNQLREMMSGVPLISVYIIRPIMYANLLICCVHYLSSQCTPNQDVKKLDVTGQCSTRKSSLMNILSDFDYRLILYLWNKRYGFTIYLIINLTQSIDLFHDISSAKKYIPSLFYGALARKCTYTRLSKDSALLAAHNSVSFFSHTSYLILPGAPNDVYNVCFSMKRTHLYEKTAMNS